MIDGRPNQQEPSGSLMRSAPSVRLSLESCALAKACWCLARVRQLISESDSLPAFLQAISTLLQQSFVNELTDTPEIVLARCFISRPFASLSIEDQMLVRTQYGGDEILPTSPFLVLEGSAGVVEGWNAPKQSSRYRVVPLNVPEFASRFPMFAEVLRQLQFVVAGESVGALDIESVGSSTQVFSVNGAVGSPFIPAQDEFVVPFGIRAAVGCGGVFGEGQCFVLLLFTRVAISERAMELLRLIALSIRLGCEVWSSSGVSDVESESDYTGLPAGDELLNLYETTVLQQASLMMEQRDQLRILAQRLMTAQEDERSRVAGELHDHVVSQLGGIGFALRSLLRCAPHTKEELFIAMEQIVLELDALAVSTRELSFRLHPLVLDQVGVSAALSRYLDNLVRRSELTVSKEFAPLGSGLAPMVSAGLYRVAQEAIQNVLKHAKATTLKVELFCQGMEVVLRLTDNGVGFELQAHRAGSAGLGLLSMAERVRQFSGTLKIDSTIMVGTIIEVRVTARRM